MSEVDFVLRRWTEAWRKFLAGYRPAGKLLRIPSDAGLPVRVGVIASMELNADTSTVILYCDPLARWARTSRRWEFTGTAALSFPYRDTRLPVVSENGRAVFVYGKTRYQIFPLEYFSRKMVALTPLSSAAASQDESQPVVRSAAVGAGLMTQLTWEEVARLRPHGWWFEARGSGAEVAGAVQALFVGNGQAVFHLTGDCPAMTIRCDDLPHIWKEAKSGIITIESRGDSDTNQSVTLSPPGRAPDAA